MDLDKIKTLAKNKGYTMNDLVVNVLGYKNKADFYMQIRKKNMRESEILDLLKALDCRFDDLYEKQIEQPL